MRKIKKPKYNMWQNTGFMLVNAWQSCKSVIVLCVILAVATTAQTVTELLLAPAVLEKVETVAPLRELIITVAAFSGALMLFSGLKRYIETNTVFGRMCVRRNILRQVANKVAQTSYPNLMEAEFYDLEDKAWEACSTNLEATEHVWVTWTKIIANVLGFSVYLILLSGLNPLLVFVAAITTIIGYVINKKINEWEYRHREEEAEYRKKITYIRRTSAGRSHAKDIRIFGLSSWMDDVWYSAFHLYQAFIRKREAIYLWTNVVDLLLTLLRNGIAYAYLIWLTLTEGMSASEFLLYFTAAGGFTRWVSGILEMFAQLHKQSLDLSMVRELLEYPEPFLFEDGESLQKDSVKSCEICLKNVSYRYPKAENDTISQMNLTIRSGENVAIVGLNGAGKTTLVKLICGFLDPTEGCVLFNGKDVRDYNRRDFYELFSAVFQEFSVLEASVAENVAQRVDYIDENRVWRCLEQAGLSEKVKSLPNGIYTNIGRQVYEDGVELSGGQLQRLMLARALYKDGVILILDEPTAALDPIAENDIYTKYHEMTAGKTSLFISHRLASTRFCDRILFIENGTIAEEGTHEELLKLGGGYAKLFEVQSKYYREGGHPNGE